MVRSCRGFTLVEVLVSFVILTMIAAIASLSLSLFLSTWDNDLMEREDFPDFMNFILLKNAVEGTYDYYVKSSRRTDMRVPLFRTMTDGFAFATSNPLWGEGETALARVRLYKQGDSYTLLYEESSLENKYVDSFEETVAYEHSRPIMKGIRSFSITYFGAEHYSLAGIYEEQMDSRVSIGGSEKYDWYSHYNGDERLMLPLKIKFVLTFDKKGEREFLFPVRIYSFDKLHIFNPNGIGEQVR